MLSCTNAIKLAPPLRHFVNSNYFEIKKLNPSLDFMIRHCDEKEPISLHTEMNNGQELMVDLSNATAETVGKVLEAIVEKGFDINAQINTEPGWPSKAYERPYERSNFDATIEKMIVES